MAHLPVISEVRPCDEVPRVTAYDGFQEFLDAFEAEGWTDGLPVAPPTASKVDALLVRAGLGSSDPIVERLGLTAEQVAINAALAGCEPEHMPLVAAAVAAHFARPGAEDSSEAGLADAAHCVIVNGPVRSALDIGSGPQCFGPGWPSNASIGRALDLVVREVGRSRGRPEPAFSTPDAYSFCFGEDEERGPWEPTHVERGFAGEESTVTVHSLLASLPSTEATRRTPEGVLDTLVETLRSRPALAGRWPDRQTRIVLVVGEEQQRVFRDADWSRAQMRDYLWPRLTGAQGSGTALALGEPLEMPIVAAGGPGMSWIWVLVAHTLAPVTLAIEDERRG
jgi:hypothetical protein